MEGITVRLFIYSCITTAVLSLEYDNRLYCAASLTTNIQSNEQYIWCEKDELCSTSSFTANGEHEYVLGCMSKVDCMNGKHPSLVDFLAATNITVTCCNTMGCNGMKGSNERILCINCPHFSLSKPTACSYVKRCDKNQQCLYHKFYSSSTNQFLHELTCEPNQVCDVLERDASIQANILGRSVESTITLEKHCCKEDLCNLQYALGKNNLSSPMLTTPLISTINMPTTQSITFQTPTTQVPTTQAPTTQNSITQTQASTSQSNSYSTSPTHTSSISTHQKGRQCYAEYPGGQEMTMTCQAHVPYCLTEIINYKDGQQDIVKGCASKSHCLSMYHLSSSNCSILTNTSRIYEDISCSFCCTQDLCNKDKLPSPDTILTSPITTTSTSVISTTLSTTTQLTTTKSTTQATTTPVVTTTTTVATTTKQPKPSQVECYTCSNCGLHRPRLYTCSHAAPFCMAEFTNYADGYRVYTKRCASAMDCDTLWFQQSRTREECSNFDPNQAHHSVFRCHFCCIEDHCNLPEKPSNHSMYIS